MKSRLKYLKESTTNNLINKKKNVLLNKLLACVAYSHYLSFLPQLTLECSFVCTLSMVMYNGQQSQHRTFFWQCVAT